jgi:hypothetical protein
MPRHFPAWQRGGIAGGEAPYGFVRRKTVKLGPYSLKACAYKGFMQGRGKVIVPLSPGGGEGNSLQLL